MKKDNNLLLKLDNDYYPKEAVITTCCQFLDDNYIFLEKRNGIKVRLSPKKAGSLQRLKNEFMNELINNTLRYNISEKNKNLREYIIKTALFFSQARESFADSALLFKDLEEAQTKDWKEDPLGIAIPWDKKNREKRRKKKNS